MLAVVLVATSVLLWSSGLRVSALLSVEAVHDRLICDPDAAVAVRPVGCEGGVVSGAVVVAVAVALTGETFRAEERGGGEEGEVVRAAGRRSLKRAGVRVATGGRGR